MEFEFEAVDELEFNSNPNRCIVNINIKEQIQYSKPVFLIKYKYTYLNEHGDLEDCNLDTPIISPHPFFVESKDNSLNSYNELGLWEDTIMDNSMTREMIKYLVMEDYELSNLIGLNTPQSFRIGIMRCLSNFRT